MEKNQPEMQFLLERSLFLWWEKINRSLRTLGTVCVTAGKRLRRIYYSFPWGHSNLPMLQERYLSSVVLWVGKAKSKVWPLQIKTEDVPWALDNYNEGVKEVKDVSGRETSQHLLSCHPSTPCVHRERTSPPQRLFRPYHLFRYLHLLPHLDTGFFSEMLHNCPAHQNRRKHHGLHGAWKSWWWAWIRWRNDGRGTNPQKGEVTLTRSCTKSVPDSCIPLCGCLQVRPMMEEGRHISICLALSYFYGSHCG